MNLESLFSQLADPITQRIHRSIIFNFRHEGRPEKWEKSMRAKVLNQITLTDTATLRNSIKVTYKNMKFTAGSNVAYARIHQEGGNINQSVTVKTHRRRINQAWGKLIQEKEVEVTQHTRQVNMIIPARPYLMIQESDVNYIKKKIEAATQQLFNNITMGTASSNS
jgi:phage gpG-like protein